MMYECSCVLPENSDICASDFAYKKYTIKSIFIKHKVPGFPTEILSHSEILATHGMLVNWVLRMQNLGLTVNSSVVFWV